MPLISCWPATIISARMSLTLSSTTTSSTVCEHPPAPEYGSGLAAPDERAIIVGRHLAPGGKCALRPAPGIIVALDIVGPVVLIEALLQIAGVAARRQLPGGAA